jgi:hypothetical protein
MDPIIVPQTNYQSTKSIRVWQYWIIMFVLWAGSYFIPGILGMGYYWYLLKPNLQALWDFLPIFNDIRLFFIWIASPFIILLIYLLNLGSSALIAKALLFLVDKQHPVRELENLNLKSPEGIREQQFHYFRGFILRIIKWKFQKSPFPWLLNWVGNYLGTIQLGKGTIIEDQFLPMQYLETETNVVLGVGDILSSQLSEGMYKGMTLKRVKIGHDTVLGPMVAVSPGVVVDSETEITSLSGIVKNHHVKGSAIYSGLPITKISNKQYNKDMKLPQSSSEKKETN